MSTEDDLLLTPDFSDFTVGDFFVADLDKEGEFA